jgi:plasmid stability protein
MHKRSDLTVRNLPEDIARELEYERKKRGTSLNETVVTALRRGLGLGLERKSNGLAALAGTWNEEAFEEFEAALREPDEQVDEEVRR